MCHAILRLRISDAQARRARAARKIVARMLGHAAPRGGGENIAQPPAQQKSCAGCEGVLPQAIAEAADASPFGRKSAPRQSRFPIGGKCDLLSDNRLACHAGARNML